MRTPGRSAFYPSSKRQRPPSGAIGRGREAVGSGEAPCFVWRDGVHVPGTVLWCDARRAHSLCFLSHAGRRFGSRRCQILCTDITLRILQLLSPTRPDEVLPCPCGRPFSLGNLRLELFPSGYLPGAASLLITLPDGRRLVYAGDLNPQAGPGCAPMQVRGAVALACHAPLCALGRSLPDRAEATAALSAHLEAARGAGVAVVLAAEVGPAQDVLDVLLRFGLQVQVHPRIYRLLAAFTEPGAALPAGARPLRPPVRAGDVVLWPLERPLAPLVPAAGATRLVPLLCTGAALSAEWTGRYARAMSGTMPPIPIPFPDGIDLPGLLTYVRATEAREVYLTAGMGPVVEQALGRMGVRLHALVPPQQLDLFAA
ncbi:MAG: hypothetical protein RMK29_12630 [Myxococcales bacterium]|nr:hypothetical protein [Myxococcota bacterium]MDW8282550.1 hypothetical protein [Myxococcales bacterium]